MTTVRRGVSAWWSRLAVAVTGGAMVAIPGEFGVVGWLTCLAVFASVFVPDSPAPAIAVLGGVGLLALAGDDPLRPAVLAMIPAVHAFHVCCGVAGVLPVRGRVHVRALRRPALRFAATQAAVFVMAGLAALLPIGRTPLVVEAAALVGLVVLAMVVLATQRAGGDHAHTAGDRRSTNDGGTMEAWGEERPRGS